jgi:hypothetical protein
MGRKWRRSKLSLTTGFIMSAMLASQAFSDIPDHDSISLKTLNGTDLYEVLQNSNDTLEVKTNNGTSEEIYKGEPISFEKTCGSCHENIVEDVRMSHHGAVGLHDMGWMDSETKGDDTGTKDFVANKVLKMRYFRSKSHYGGW